MTTRGQNTKEPSNKDIALTVAAGLLAGAGLFVASRYKVANAAQYIVKTGIGIPTVSITKKTVQWPFQTAVAVSLTPRNYNFSLQAMSRGMMEIILPGVFTIGPKDNMAALQKYVTLLSGDDINEAKMTELIKGVIEGEVRVLAANLEIEEIFESREKFRQNIIETVQVELDKFGMDIYNANLKELEDAIGSEFFIHTRQRKRATAENQARKDIAEAKFYGDVAVKEKQTATRVQTAQFESTAVLAENSRDIDMAKSKSEKEVQEANYTRLAEISKIEAKKAAAIRDMELQRDLEKKVIEQQLEFQRSKVVVQAMVDAEAKQRMADATLYQAIKEADAIRAKYDAQADGLRNLLSCADPQTVIQYSMIDRGIFQALASENAKAIQGLQPKLWIMGDSSANATNAIGGIMKSLPPLLTTLYEQTGIRPPKWAVDMDNAIANGTEPEKK